jgi:hypothetical protein
MAASDADAIPLPKEETTPPVTNIYRVIEKPKVCKKEQQLSKADGDKRSKMHPLRGVRFIFQDGAPVYPKEVGGSMKRFFYVAILVGAKVILARRAASTSV